MIFALLFRDMTQRIQNDEQSNDHYKRQNDCESLAHRNLFSGLQSGEIAGAKLLPIVFAGFGESIPVALKTIRESTHL
jgi:hypothetical protein